VLDFRRPRLLVIRRVVGLILAAVAVIDLVATVIGFWNPWRYVILERYFSDPITGGARGLVLAAAAVFLLTPVTTEAVQHRRVMIRWGMVAAAVLALLCAGALGRIFLNSYQLLGTDPSGTRQVVVVSHGEDRELRMWAGRSLTRRDAGRLGPACGNVTVVFPSPDEVRLVTSYGTFDLRLEPGTGRPRDTFGPTCAG
jgi:hypothetical protein